MCNLAAQGALTAQGSIQAVGGERTDGAGNGTVGVQAVPEPDPGHRAGIETAALMLGTDKSRGYCVEMICADFLAGANLENGNSEVLLQLVVRFFKFLPREAVVSPSRLARRRCESMAPKHPRIRLEAERQRVLRRDGWRCQSCGTMSNLEVHHKQFRSHSGHDSEENLVTLCTGSATRKRTTAGNR